VIVLKPIYGYLYLERKRTIWCKNRIRFTS